MIFDANNVFAGSFSPTTGGINGQTVTGTGAVNSVNILDLQISRDMGEGSELEVLIYVVTAASGGTGVQFQLVEADDAALTQNVQILNQSAVIPTASLTQGARIPLHFDRASPLSPRRYLAVIFQLVGTLTAGAYFAALVKSVNDPQLNVLPGFAVL